MKAHLSRTGRYRSPECNASTVTRSGRLLSREDFTKWLYGDREQFLCKKCVVAYVGHVQKAAETT